MKKPLVSIACALGALAFALSGCGASTPEANGSGTSSSSDTSETTSTDAGGSSDASSGDSSFEDGILTTPTMKIEITDHKIIPTGEKGNEYGEKPVIAFWYEITNLTDEDVTPLDFLFVFEAYQDNNPDAENRLEVGSLPDDQFLDSQTENIKQNGTVENAVAYELDDDTTPVDLVASNDLGATEIGRMTYSLK